MSERVKFTIIGGGVIGCAIAYQLSKKYDEIFVFEKNTQIKAENQSSRNSGVIHAGVYYPEAVPVEGYVLGGYVYAGIGVCGNVPGLCVKGVWRIKD